MVALSSASTTSKSASHIHTIWDDESFFSFAPRLLNDAILTVKSSGDLTVRVRWLSSKGQHFVDIWKHPLTPETTRRSDQRISKVRENEI